MQSVKNTSNYIVKSWLPIGRLRGYRMPKTAKLQKRLSVNISGIECIIMHSRRPAQLYTVYFENNA